MRKHSLAAHLLAPATEVPNRYVRKTGRSPAPPWPRPAQRGVARATVLMTIAQRGAGTWQECCPICRTHTKTHARPCYLHVEGISSVWLTDVSDNNELACEATTCKRSRRRRENRTWGMSKLRPSVVLASLKRVRNETAVSQMTWNIRSQWTRQAEGF